MKAVWGPSTKADVGEPEDSGTITVKGVTGGIKSRVSRRRVWEETRKYISGSVGREEREREREKKGKTKEFIFMGREKVGGNIKVN